MQRWGGLKGRWACGARLPPSFEVTHSPPPPPIPNPLVLLVDRTDRTYAFEGAPADLLDSYHTYLKVPMSTSPPCSTEGGFVGTLFKDAQVGICCANHGTYTSAAGNLPYAGSADDDEGYDNRYGLEWTAHSGEFSLSNHAGTPCECVPLSPAHMLLLWAPEYSLTLLITIAGSFFETFLEAGKHRICCSEAWASGVFLSTPAVTCT